MSKFKEGQLVWWDSKPHKLYSSYSGWVITPFNSDKPEIIISQELINLLTRDEIIEHMIDNGWSEYVEDDGTGMREYWRGERYGIVDVVLAANGRYLPKVNADRYPVSDKFIKAQEQAYNYATALNLCEQ